MKPSKDRYLIRFNVVPGSSLMGWYFSNSLPKKALKRKKSTNSAAESISAYIDRFQDGERLRDIHFLSKRAYLNDSLGLTKHGRGIEIGSVFCRHQISHIKKEFESLIQGNSLPFLLSLKRSLDGFADQLWSGVVKLGHLLAMIVRLKVARLRE